MDEMEFTEAESNMNDLHSEYTMGANMIEYNDDEEGSEEEEME